MKAISFAVMLMVLTLGLPPAQAAESSAKPAAQSSRSGEPTKVRRKKVEMCKECGKPEPECECEHKGEEHGHDDHGHGKGHSDSDGHNHHTEAGKE